MKIKLPLMLTIFLSCSAMGMTLSTPENRFEAHSCKKEIQKLTHQWMGRGDWKLSFTSHDSIALLRPTHKFAHWMLLEKSGEVETLSLINPNTIQKVTFDKKCKGAFTSASHNQYLRPKSFTDEKLLNEMVSHKKGIIAVWSPRMPASLMAIERIQKVSNDLKLPVVFVMDPLADEKNAIKVLKKNDLKLPPLQKLSSLELTLRDATLNYPSFFVYKDGRITGGMNTGLMSENDYKKSILQGLGRY